MCQVRFFWGGGGKICMHCEVGEEWRKKAILCLCMPGWTCWLILVSAFWNQIHEDKEPGKLWSFWIFSSTFNPSNNYCLSVLGSLEFWWHKTNPHNSHFEVYFLCKLPCSAIVVNLSYVVMCIMFLLFTCSCGDGTLGTPNQRGDNYECRNMKLLLKQQQRVRLCAFVEFKGKCYCMIWIWFFLLWTWSCNSLCYHLIYGMVLSFEPGSPWQVWCVWMGSISEGDILYREPEILCP